MAREGYYPFVLRVFRVWFVLVGDGEGVIVQYFDYKDKIELRVGKSRFLNNVHGWAEVGLPLVVYLARTEDEGSRYLQQHI